MEAAPPPPRPPCGLTRQEVLAWRENGLVPVVDGRCQNGYTDADGDHLCGRFVGAHPSEIALTVTAPTLNGDPPGMREMSEKLDSLHRQVTTIASVVIEVSAQSKNLWRGSNISGKRDHDLRVKLKQHLGYGRKEKISCMVTRHCGDGEEVIAAHIVPCASDQTLLRRSLGLYLADLGTVRNGLFLAHGIEKAFDKLQISFVKNSNPLLNSLVMKIWDDSCRVEPIYPGSPATIGSYEGHELNLIGPNGKEHNPYLRALSYHAYEACIVNAGARDMAELFYGTPGSYGFNNDLSMLKERFFIDVRQEMSGSDDDSI